MSSQTYTVQTDNGQQLVIVTGNRPDDIKRDLALSMVAGLSGSAGQVVAVQTGPVHCGKSMVIRQGKYICVVCGAEF